MIYGIGITLEDINSHVSGYILIKKGSKENIMGVFSGHLNVVFGTVDGLLLIIFLLQALYIAINQNPRQRQLQPPFQKFFLTH